MKRALCLLILALVVLSDVIVVSQSRRMRTFRTAIQTAAPPPTPDFSCLDIGSVLSAGSYVENPSGTYTIVGHGTTYGTADALHYCYLATSGNQEMIAQVTSCGNGMHSQECGLMVRQSTAAGSINVGCRFGDTTAYAEWRASTNGTTDSALGAAITTGYLRMRVVDNVAYCATSPDAIVWTDITIANPATIPDAYLIGMAVDSNDVAATTGVFANVTIAEYEEEEDGGYRAHWGGFGADALGGLGGEDEYCIVNTLTVSGSPTWPDGGGTGDIEDCLEAAPTGCAEFTGTRGACARYVFFGVSGRFTDADGLIEIRHPYLTIAGQTAPNCDEGSAGSAPNACSDGGGGVLIYDTPIVTWAPHVIWQHVAIRRLLTGGVYMFAIGKHSSNDNAHMTHVVLDHMSISWVSVEAQISSAEEGSQNLLIVDSIISESLYPGGLGGLGAFFFGPISCQVTVARSVFAHHFYRVPWTMSSCQTLQYNNVVYNSTNPVDTVVTALPGIIDSNFGFWGATSAVFRNNAIINGPDSDDVGPGSPGPSGVNAHSFGFSIHPTSLSAGVEVYLDGNTGPGITGATGTDQWAGALFQNYITSEYTQVGTYANIHIDAAPSWYASFASGSIDLIANSSNQTRDNVVGTCSGGTYDNNGNAGARPLDASSLRRDVNDARVLCDVTEGTGGNGTLFLDTDDIALPTLAQRTWDIEAQIPTSPGADGTCGSFLVGSTPTPRSRMMCWLEGLAQRLEVFQGTP